MKEFLDKISKFSTIGVFSHIRPDGDALGSQVAFCHWLQIQGIRAFAFNEDPPPDNLTWLLGHYPIQKPTAEHIDRCEAFVFLDGNAQNRFGKAAESLIPGKKPFFLIDHHPEPELKYEAAVYNVKATSTAELVFMIYLSTDLNKMNASAAKALYTGIMTDTGSFRFDSVTSETHTMIAEILRIGKFSPTEIHELIYDGRKQHQIRLLGMALQTIKQHEKGIATMAVSKKMMTETGCEKEDTEGFVSYPMSLQGSIAAALMIEIGGRVKLSLRTKRHIDANKWARTWGGGGHVRASGAWFNGSLEQAEKAVVETGLSLYSETE